MKVLVRILYSQALRLVPSSKRPKARYAFKKVSCTRSSASAGLRVMRSAAEYSDGMCSMARYAKCAWSAMACTIVIGCSLDGPGRAGAGACLVPDPSRSELCADRFHLGVRLERLMAHLPAPSRLLVAAEGQRGVEDVV